MTDFHHFFVCSDFFKRSKTYCGSWYCIVHVFSVVFFVQAKLVNKKQLNGSQTWYALKPTCQLHNNICQKDFIFPLLFFLKRYNSFPPHPTSFFLKAYCSPPLLHLLGHPPNKHRPTNQRLEFSRFLRSRGAASGGPRLSLLIWQPCL